MGGVTTWFAFLENLDLISVFLPLSGDCWQFGGLGGGKETEKTAQYLHDQTVEQGFGKNDFRIFAGTGYEDIACPDSIGKTFYAIPDGSYLFIDNGKAELRGEAYMVKDGIISHVSSFGHVLPI